MSSHLLPQSLLRYVVLGEYAPHLRHLRPQSSLQPRALPPLPRGAEVLTRFAVEELPRVLLELVRARTINHIKRTLSVEACAVTTHAHPSDCCTRTLRTGSPSQRTLHYHQEKLPLLSRRPRPLVRLALPTRL